MSAAALAELRAWTARVRSLGELGKQAAPAVAIALGQELRRTIGASEEPSGKPWQPKADGGEPLTHAMRAIRINVVGATVTIVVSGPEARHHLGFAKGAVRRRIIPTSRRLPPAYAQAVSRAIAGTFERIMNGKAGTS